MLNTSHNYNLREHLTFRVGARCNDFITYDDARADLPELYRQGLFGRRWIHIGAGSNMLFAADFAGTVIDCTDTRHRIDHTPDGTYFLTASAGCTTDDLVALTTSRGLYGLENLSGIPGKLGGCVVQNIGAYGAELKDAVVTVTCYDTEADTFITYDAADCHFGYRTSRFKQAAGRYIVVEATLRLTDKATPRLDYGALRQQAEAMAQGAEITPAIVRSAVIALRDSKLPDPRVTGSAGSFFKNPVMPQAAYDRVVATARSLWGDDVTVPHYDLPDGEVKVPAAWFIDRCGWKGRRMGGAAVWEKQPLVLVNLSGDASAADIIALKDAITADVASRFGISLTPEVVIVEAPVSQ